MKFIKKLVNLSLVGILSLGCFGLVACDNKPADTTNTVTTLNLSQVTQICDATFEDLQQTNGSSNENSSSNANIDYTQQTDLAGISYSDYTSYIPNDLYTSADDLINYINTKYQLFKSNVLDLNKTYEYKVIDENAGDDFYFYLRISSNSSSSIAIEWSQTEDSISEDYNQNVLYKSMTINLDNSLNWQSIELKDFADDVYGSQEVDATYYHIIKATNNNDKYSEYTQVTSNYNYLHVNHILGKSISLNCSHSTVLTNNQIMAKNYINSLELTDNEKTLDLFNYEAEFRGQFMASDL